MSNYIINLQDRKTGEEIKVCAFDNWFGKHQYGYKVLGDIDGKVMNEEEFEAFKAGKLSPSDTLNTNNKDV